MKTTYHFIIDKDEVENFERIIKHLGASINAKISMNTDTKNTVEYLVHLSKYEFLLVRLSCKLEKIVEVPENV